MKIKFDLINTILIAVAMIVLMTGIASVQTSCAVGSDEKMTFTVEQYGDFEVRRYAGYDETILSGCLLVSSPELSFYVYFSPTENRYTRIEAANSVRPRSRSFNELLIVSNDTESEVVDISSLPPDAQALWRNAMAIATELNDTSEFWEFLNAGKDEETAEAQFAQFGDGYHFPTLYSERIRLSQVAAQINHNGLNLGRGYQLLVPNQVMILTPDPPGTENPSISVTVMGEQGFKDYGEFFFDPEAVTIEITDMNPGSREPLTEEEWEARLSELTDILTFIQTQIPSYISAGILEEDNELELFITKILEWSESFEREVIEPTPVPADFMN